MQHRKNYEISPVIKDLAHAFSQQSKHSNQMWLAIVIASAPMFLGSLDDGEFVVPFFMASVDASVLIWLSS